MLKIVELPAPCELRSVIRFLLVKNLYAADIHRQICEVYGATAMCKGKVCKWVRDFKGGRDNIHDEPRSGRPSVITDDMVASVEAKILKNRRFAVSTLSNHFPVLSRSVLYLARGGRFDNLEHFGDTEQAVQVTYYKTY